MRLLRWLGKKLRGLGWWAWNRLYAWLSLDLADQVDRKGSTPTRKLLFQLWCTVRVLLLAGVIWAAVVLLSPLAGLALAIVIIALEWPSVWGRS